jgi:hypothetical protein
MPRNLVKFSPLLLLAACANTPSGAGDCPSTTYRIDHVEALADAHAADLAGYDLDGDGRPDNVSGTILAGMLTAYDAHASWQTRIDGRLASDVRWSFSVEQCPGAAPKVLDDNIPLGALADLGGGADAGWQPVTDLHFDGTRLGGALVPDYRDTLADTFAPYVSARLAAGDTIWGAQADTNHDGVISPDEVLADELFQTVTTPDIDTDGDGVRDSLSFGFVVHAVPE